MATATQKAHSFRLELAGIQEPTIEVADAIYGSGIDDALILSEEPILSLDFHREAPSLGDAIGSAVKAVEKVGFKVARVIVDDPSQE